MFPTDKRWELLCDYPTLVLTHARSTIPCRLMSLTCSAETLSVPTPHTHPPPTPLPPLALRPLPLHAGSGTTVSSASICRSCTISITAWSRGNVADKGQLDKHAQFTQRWLDCPQREAQANKHHRLSPIPIGLQLNTHLSLIHI